MFTPMHEIPEELCGEGGCVFLPHEDNIPHTWERLSQQVAWKVAS